MTFELIEDSCFPPFLFGVHVGLALLDAIIAVLAFYQLARIQSRDSRGWTRQKVFHLLIGSSNLGYFAYFILALFAACNGWLCWSGSCGFVFMGNLPLTNIQVDLCHQPEDEDDEDEERSFEEGLLEKISSKPSTSNTDWSRRWWLPVRLPHVGSRQNLVILVVTIIFVLTLAFAVILWFEMGNISIDSLVAVQVVYVDFFAVVTLLLGGALAVYGLLLFLKMRRVRSERASSEISKVAGLAAVSVVCFTSSALVAILTNIPVSIQWQRQYHIYGAYTSILQITYYFIGSTIPSAFVLWIMRELPPWIAASSQEQTRTITFVCDDSATVHRPQEWTLTTNSPVPSRGSPI
ncbi:tobamovirus multiplication protein 1-like isoform X2 [Cucumis melo]|uniref:Tobamovirus multiplication protein 1-like isoform X2 n=1 Tax=Cucumis melo TaxID=3656 RepID=A0ABM3KFD8_CUCME|nr:tobamovirus multiplication protein 1-like isoform X2 [Cucumis melo]